MGTHRQRLYHSSTVLTHPTPTTMVKVIESPEVPFVHFMDTDWIQRIYIKGKAPAGGSRFTVYLQRGSESEPDEVAFVFDARFNFGECHKKIVTNHKREGNWGSEEDGDCPFPFEEEQDFKIKIVVEDDSFKVYVNGEKLLEYEQKLSMKTINCIRIENDVVLDQVKLK
uniref:Galectin n=1 Tax=Sinonovacula constricta TaxID=98310 RepID=A0A3R5VPR7_SINCO|nr:galectin [Sinonovacula constricta]